MQVLQEQEDLNLVMSGEKPMMLLVLDPPEEKFRSCTLKSLSKDVVYFCERWDKYCVNVVVFNKVALEKLLPEINKSQSRWNFDSVEMLIEQIRDRYRRREEYKTLDLNFRKDYVLVESICFGYPRGCIDEFLKEAVSTKLRPDRIVHEVSPNVVFIGYPEYKSECLALIKKWKKVLS